jgi:hypothetical protein
MTILPDGLSPKAGFTILPKNGSIWRKRTGESMRAREMEALLARFCKELLMPEMGVIRTRLLLTADLMRYTDREKELVEQTLAVALNLTNCGLPLHKTSLPQALCPGKHGYGQGSPCRGL